MKQKKKKLSATQKAEIKAKMKRLLLGGLHVISYILSILFIIVCVVAGVQSCSGKPKQKANINNNQNSAYVLEPQRSYRAKPKAEDLTRIFYPNDIVINSSIKYYLNLNFSNYNYLEYFWPDPDKLLYFDKYLNTFIHNHEGQDQTMWLPLRSIDSDGEEVEYVRYYDPNEDITIDFSYLCCDFDYYDQDPWVYWYLYNEDDANLPLFGWGQGVFTSYLDSDQNEYGILPINAFDYVFTQNVAFFRFDEYIQRSSSSTQFARFCAYYFSNYSFDYNSYVFGGLDKYVSFTYLFKRIYNGFFIYVPNKTALYLDNLVLFKGVWEYKNTIYTSISLNLQRAWNGQVSYQGRNFTYTVDYVPPFSAGWFNDIFSGSNEALVNYYFIKDIVMTGVNGQSITLAYNRISNTVPSTSALQFAVYPGQNLRLFQDDSWLLNNNIEFVLYSIDYDYTFSQNTNLFNAYQYYADFFFSAFTYTGIYSSVKPGSVDDESVQVLAPVFTMLALALTGILPFLNVVILPGVSLGTLLVLPFVISIILFVVRLFKR